MGQTSPAIITTIGGGGTASGDGGLATDARMAEPIDIAVDGAGNVFVAERYSFKVRRISPSGILTTVAGNGQQVYNGDGIAATSASIDVRGIAADLAGNLYIADGSNRRVRKVAPNGIISTIARVGLSFPTRVAVSRAGTVFVIDNTRVWKVTASGTLELFAGTGEYGSAGDGGPATLAQFSNPSSLSFDRQGNAYLAEVNERIRRIDSAGTVTTVAGGGTFRLDPVATNYRLPFPRAAVADSRGNLYVAGLTNSVRVVNRDGIAGDAVGRVIDGGNIIAGAKEGFAGDGGPAVDALLYEPEALAIDEQDNLYIADTRNNRVRKVTPVPDLRTPDGKGAFAPYVAYAVGSYVLHVAVADITGDGRDDAMLLTNNWPGYPEPNDFKILLFVQRPDGTLAAPVGKPFAGDVIGGRAGRGMDTGDLNGDGFQDAVIGTLSGITVFLGSASGLRDGVTYASRFAGAEAVSSVVVMDVDQDGHLDVVTLSSGRAEGGTSPDDRVGLLVYLGNGAGGFPRQTFQPRPNGVNWRYLRSANMNKDGFPDLTGSWSEVVTGGYTGGFEVTLHNRMGGFGAVTQVRPAQLGPWGPGYATGDFNSDGYKDAVVAHEANTPDARYVLFNQQAGGGYAEARQWAAFDVPTEMLGEDMNNDGREDLLVLHSGWHGLGYMQQTVRGELDEEYKTYLVESGNHFRPAMAVGDLNSDGCKDVAISDRNYGLVVLAGRNCLRYIRANGSSPLIPGRASTLPMAAQSSWVLQVPRTSSSARPLVLAMPSHTSAAKARQVSSLQARQPFVQAWMAWALLGLAGAGLAAYSLARRSR